MSKIRVPDVRRALAAAPSTALELATILGMTRRNVNVAIWCLQTQGDVRCIGDVPHPEWTRGRRCLKLYDLTPRGRQKARKIISVS